MILLGCPGRYYSRSPSIRGEDLIMACLSLKKNALSYKEITIIGSFDLKLFASLDICHFDVLLKEPRLFQEINKEPAVSLLCAGVSVCFYLEVVLFTFLV